MKTTTAARLLFGTTTIVLITGYIFAGPRHGFDSQGYVRLGQIVIDWLLRGDYQGEPFPTHVQIPKYLIPGILIGGCYKLFGEYGHQAIIALNTCLFSFTALLLFKSWRLLDSWNDDLNPGMIIGVIFLLFCLVDVPQWVYYDLSDVIFLCFAMGFTYLLLMGVVQRSNGSIVMALTLVLIGYFMRPTAIIFPIVWLLFFLALLNWPTRGLKGALSIGLSIVILLVIFLSLPLFVELWMHNETAARGLVPRFLLAPVAQSMHMFEQGWVVANRPSTFVSHPTPYGDFLLVAIKRFVYFFVPLRIEYSAIHNILNTLYSLTVLYLAFLGLQRLWNKSERSRRVTLVLCINAFLYGMMHAFTLNSYDWRYQLPAMIPLWIFAGLGILSLRNQFDGKLAQLSPRSQQN